MVKNFFRITIILFFVFLTNCSSVNMLTETMKSFGSPSKTQVATKQKPATKLNQQTVATAKPEEPAKGPDYSQLPNSVVVSKGDTLYSISQKYNLPLGYILAKNNIEPPYKVYVGQRLILPKPRVHIVKKSETLYSISRQYDAFRDSIVKENNLQPPFDLNVGQKLVIPAPIETAEAVTVPQHKPNTNKEQKKNYSSSPLASPPPRSGSKFSWPIKGKVVSRFGAKEGGLYNDGINIAATKGAAVKAAENGVVAYTGDQIKGFGNMVLVKHQGDYMTAYAHLDAINVGKGQAIKIGQSIGTVGSTGTVSSPQLHFEIRKGRKAIDPVRYLN